MNAISKKLLSVLLVLTMVLSMVSVGGLSIFAVETEAASYTNPGQAGITKATTVRTKAAELATLFAEDEDGSVEAECPACEETVTWTAMTDYRPTQNPTSHQHVYWDFGSETANPGAAQNWISQNQAYNICLHLNGMNLELNYARVFWSNKNATLNIMGEGTVTAGVSPSSTTSYNRGLFQIGAGTVNLYGGTYELAEDAGLSDNTYALARLNATSSVLNIYEGVTITSSVSCINIIDNGTVNMYGGTIKNGKGRVVDGNALGGNVHMTGGTFNMYGGTIKQEGETATVYNGGNVYASGGAFNMYGNAEISGGKVTYRGGNVYTSAALTMAGNSSISGGYCGNQAGNIYAGSTNILMTEGASIEGGIAKSSNPNILLYKSNLVMQDDTTVVGGYKYDGTTVTYNTTGTGVSTSTTSTVTLCDNATFESMEGQTQLRLINIGSGCTLRIDNGWTGSASYYGETGLAAGGSITRGICGAYDEEEGTFTQGGTFAGELIYYNTQTGIAAADGVLTVGAVYVQTSTGNVWYASNEDALTAYYANDGYESGYIFTAAGDSTLVLSGDIYIESRGYAMTLSGTGTVHALDKANDDYDGNGSWTVTSENVTMAGEAVNPINSRRYVVIETGEDTNVYGAHRIEVKLTAVTLRTTAAGLYYKASYTCDETLAGRITTYGVALNVTAVPTADFENEANTGFSTLTGFKDAYDAETNSVSGTSCGLFGVFKNEEGRDNVGYAAKEIFANAYIEVDMNGSEDYKVFVGSNGTGYTFAKALEAVNTMVGENKLTEAQLESLEQFYTDWSSLGDTFWADYSNIAALGNA